MCLPSTHPDGASGCCKWLFVNNHNLLADKSQIEKGLNSLNKLFATDRWAYLNYMTNHMACVLQLSVNTGLINKTRFFKASIWTSYCFSASIDWGAKTCALHGLLHWGDEQSPFEEESVYRRQCRNYHETNWNLLSSSSALDCLLWKEDTVMQGKLLNFWIKLLFSSSIIWMIFQD